MKRKSLKLSFEYMDTPERRVLSLDADGVPCVPVLGFDAYRRQWRAAPIHVHDECVEISLCLRGNLEFEMGGKRYPFRPGSVFVARPDEPHRLRASCSACPRAASASSASRRRRRRGSCRS